MPMPTETDADRLAMIRAVDDTVAIYHGTTISVIFDNNYELAEVGEGFGVSGRQPMLQARTSDLPGIREGSQITVAAADYVVAAHRPDGTGMTEIALRESD